MNILKFSPWGLLLVLVLSLGCSLARAYQIPPEPPRPTALSTRAVRPLAPAESVTTPAAVVPSLPSRGFTFYLPLVSKAEPPAAPPLAVSQPTPSATATATPTETPEPTKEAEEPSKPEPLSLRTDLPAMALQDWPRPAEDNGRCMHFVRDQYFGEEALRANIARLQQLGAKWTLVVYADENQLKMAAPAFAQAGITPVWRKMLRPSESYYGWERDIRIIEAAGLPPYMQLYNEPSLPAEWDEDPDQINEGKFLKRLMQATRDVYNAGGYVGWQFINPEWLENAITRLQVQQGEAVLDRFFFIPHPYGMNHPPNYTEDLNGALGFLYFADIFQRRIGRVPPMVAGEGGWKINAANDGRFPPIDETRHRDFHVEMFNWFRTGTLSNDQPLPDYFFAYCVWLIADKGDDNAWWDSFAGNRQATIAAVAKMPPFVRRFSWDR
ncbi:MAG TPA: hypothetical protein DEP84_30610 [Chloroflexi bacterium]|nr:hypothetical protein [Chloroflexota bacterium]